MHARLLYARWRGLTAGNPLVRANAAALLVGAFPLQNPNLVRTSLSSVFDRGLVWNIVELFCCGVETRPLYAGDRLCYKHAYYNAIHLT